LSLQKIWLYSILWTSQVLEVPEVILGDSVQRFLEKFSLAQFLAGMR